jgi:hypothetical protein
LVRKRAGVAVIAGHIDQLRVEAAFETCADIFSAAVVVIAEHFIGLSIAVVIEAVTHLFGRLVRIARGQPFSRADPHSRAAAPRVFLGADRE